MGDKLKGKVAVVTGAGRGLGRAHALALANQGAALVINDVGGALDGSGKGTTAADEVVNEIKAKGGKAVANYDSVSDPAGAERIIKTAVDTFGFIDILVNNAGILRDRMSFNMTTEEWDAVLKVHLYGNFFCSKYAGIMFRQQKRGGRIIGTSSVAALGNMGQANYAAAKAGILGLVYTFALELGRYGVTANALFPAAATRMTASKELMEAWDRQAATGSITQEALAVRKQIMELKPEAVAEVVAYLATDEAANINGYVFEVAGNRVSLYSKMAAITGIIKKEGYWTCEELADYIPKTMGGYLVNPSPPQP